MCSVCLCMCICTVYGGNNTYAVYVYVCWVPTRRKVYGIREWIVPLRQAETTPPALYWSQTRSLLPDLSAASPQLQGKPCGKGRGGRSPPDLEAEDLSVYQGFVG